MRVLPTKWRRKPTGIDVERNDVIVTLCIDTARIVCAAGYMKQSSVCLSRQLTAAAVAGGFAAEVRRTDTRPFDDAYRILPASPIRMVMVFPSSVGSWVKKTRHQTLGHNFTNYYPIFKIFSLADSVVNLQQIRVQIFYHTVNMSLHYLVKYKCRKMASF